MFGVKDMGLPGFEPKSPTPKDGRIAKLPHRPIELLFVVISAIGITVLRD